MPPTILISNDDGINSEGLHKLHETLGDLGEVFVVAPDRDQSAVSHSLSLYRPLRIEQISDNVYTVDGTPTDCVNIAVNGILKDRKIDIVVSGINKGENLGDDITYSGTVSAAMEGALLGVPSIAVSLATKVDFNFEAAAYYSKLIAEYVLRSNLPPATILNVNVPHMPKGDIRGILVTRQGKRVYGEPIVEKVDPRGKKYYWIGGYELGSLDIENSDIAAVKSGYVSVTPISLDLTDYGFLDKLRGDLPERP
ncbi:MAG: 5'/3'-nucleotidase SurE [Candidatus Dadabacteria bacterium]|nr:5'/3'-nucleotidase SurE [Candidatus Dadabacteria bacterium]